jgi:hypothetical protein
VGMLSSFTENCIHLLAGLQALIEMAPGGSGPAVARALMARQDRAGRMQIGESWSAAQSV